MKEYLLDILFWRVDPFVFKTAEFFKRNWNSLKNTMQHIMYELRKIKQGFRRMKYDIKFTIGWQKAAYESKYTKVNVLEQQRVRQVKQYMLKFIPFSLFLIIPGMEFFLPPFLIVFPNSVPSQFMSDEARVKKFNLISERREKAAIRLKVAMPSYILELEKDEALIQSDLI